MAQTVILSAARTPFAKLGGGLAGLSGPELGTRAAAAALERSGVAPADVGYVVMGQVLQAGAGQIPSRQVSVGIGLGPTVGSETINKVCASGMRAATLADVMIRAGEHDVIVAGGMESMSNSPYLLPKGRFGYRMGDGTVIDSMTFDGLTCTFDGLIMAEQNSQVSAEMGISREEQDAWALRSHQRAVAAIDEGRFADEIAPVTVPGRKGDTVVDTDEGPRRDTSAEKLAALPPVLVADGSTTAGNAPGVNDGAAALVLASDTWARDHGLTPLAAIRGVGYVADDYAYLVRTPAAATRIALEKAGVGIGDVDLLEVNEAFCSVALNTVALLGMDEDRVNVNGGAVALGHPIGASGARLLGTLVHELRRRGGGIGVAAICSGAAQGDATVLEVFAP
ncbi:MAG TPA: acetyl-CoA C-acetyltransferase [Gaiellales bacterium]|jgi:acetyl-CoA C-acetyltransferase|nr:acetyl-CoA C-acetyltransferase [Gaiellales bacterium]